MIGLLYLGFFLLYLLVTVLLTWFAIKAARRRGLAGWKWGLPVVLVMYLLVFWDWLPTYASHRYYCQSEGGYTQYKSLGEWKRKNPGVAETLEANKGARSVREGNRERYVLNQRFAWDIIRSKHSLYIREREERIVDTKTGEVLARYVDFDTDIAPIGIGGKNSTKFWLAYRSCEPGQKMPQQIEFNGYLQSIKKLGGNENGHK